MIKNGREVCHTVPHSHRVSGRRSVFLVPAGSYLLLFLKIKSTLPRGQGNA